nr:DHA2 family efflux MFS transporter permease subunit [Corynebacterium sp. TAE3-ERU12]
MPLKQAWLAIIPLCTAFFMILLDQTIVAVATPDIMTSLGADYNEVIWVTSAFLLTYAVPLLVMGRLGDQFGQKRIFQTGVALFTIASLCCGLAPTVEMLIIARALQGLGASMISPQSLSIITRVFAPESRGPAMGMWGTVAGLAALSGPILGGVIVTGLTWHWIFFINVPVGLACVLMAAKFVPNLPGVSRSFDIPSIVVSLIAMSLLVFGLQQGQGADWALWVWLLIIGGIGLVAVFVWLQATASRREVEALVPLRLFANSNFSRGSFSIATMGFAVASNALPIMIYLQRFEHTSALTAGLLIAPMAIVSGLLAPLVGKLIGRIRPRVLSMFGFAMMVAGHIALWAVMRPDMPLWAIPVASVLLGFGNGCVWAPNSTTTMGNIARDVVGAASGVYNTARQVGAVLGSAATAAFIQWREAAGAGSELLGQALLMQAVILVLGFVAVAGFRPNTSESP